eukprot:sb/3464284/
MHDACNTSLSQSTGRLDGQLVVNDRGEVELRYTGGAKCGKDGFYSTRITFICDSSTMSSPRLISFTNCEYYILWRTSQACLDIPPTPSTTCGISDPRSGFLYDLQPLHLTESHYKVPLDTKTNLMFNVCGSVSGCNDGAAVCSSDPTQLDCVSCAPPAKHKCKGGLEHNIPPSPRKRCLGMCYVTLSMCSNAACQHSPKECDFKIGQNVYNFGALARRTGNWIAKDQNQRSFHLNMCRGVNLDSSLKGCSPNSIGCLSESSGAGANSIGLVDTQEEEGNLTLSYTGGSTVICEEHPARTEIQFSCGNTLGSPTFLHDRECRYLFEWRTYVACATPPVKSQSCSYTHPQTSRAVDLSGKGSYTTATTDYTVRFEDCGNRKLCNGATVCVELVDNINGKILQIASNEIQLFAEGDTAEVMITSDVRCEDSSYKYWQGIIQYTCSENETMALVAISHCHVIVNRGTPLVCGSVRAIVWVRG